MHRTYYELIFISLRDWHSPECIWYCIESFGSLEAVVGCVGERASSVDTLPKLRLYGIVQAYLGNYFNSSVSFCWLDWIWDQNLLAVFVAAMNLRAGLKETVPTQGFVKKIVTYCTFFYLRQITSNCFFVVIITSEGAYSTEFILI